MSRSLLPTRAWRAARLQDAGIWLGYVVPWCIAACVVTWRMSGTRLALILGGMTLLACVAIGWRRWYRLDANWLVRSLNSRRGDMEDSADLLLHQVAVNPLQRLQQQRIVNRLHESPANLRKPWPVASLASSTVIAFLISVIAVQWPTAPPRGMTQAQPAARHPSGIPALQRINVQITPPRYTRLPARSVQALSFKAPADSIVQWSLRFSHTPVEAALIFLDGREVPLQSNGTTWTARLTLAAPALYRLQVDGQLWDAGKLHRIDVTPDLPPQVNVVQPVHSLSLASARQPNWEVGFVANDDYGVRAQAVLHLTLTQGSGENISFHEQHLKLDGQGTTQHRRYQHQLDLSALGMTEGSDLIVQLEVADNHAPQRQLARSPSIILRMGGKPEVESAGIEGVVRRVLPAYFRSQRQIILDAEALQKKRRTLAPGMFLKQSDAIGVDQRILRLRYGQFLGEEAEGGPKPPPTGDATQAEHAQADDDHGHEAPGTPTPIFGQVDHLLENFGHTHDIAEAATLLDPETRATLKQALDQMWQSELQLRQGQPDLALPYAYKALGLIKKVQQADRIFLARVGPQLPPVDERRRMTGKRDGIASRTDPLQTATAGTTEITALWLALSSSSPVLPLQAFDTWLRSHPQQLDDPLSLQAAMDAVHRDPACSGCRAELQRQLWPLLPVPPAQPMRRAPPTPQGRRYLDALQTGGTQ